MRHLSAVLLPVIIWIGMSALPQACYASGTTAQPAPASNIEKPISDTRAQIRQWQTSANIQVSLVLIVIVCGALISAFHRLGAGWAKNAVLVMGVATSIATGVSGSSAVFSADYRSLRKAVSEGNRIVARMDSIAAIPNLNSMSTDDYAAVKQQMDAQLDNFEKISQRIESNGGQKSDEAQSESPSGLFHLPVVSAQANAAPSWIQSPPTDGRNLYFVGANTSTSLAVAKDSALKDGVNKLERAFELTPPYLPSGTRTALVRGSYVVQDTFFQSNGGTTYTVYTLLRISRDLQRMQLGPLEYKQSGWRPVDLAFDPTGGMFVLDRDGKVFRVTVDQDGVHIQALFAMPPASGPAAITANTEAVYVSANTQIGCTVFQYALSTGKVSRKNVGVGKGSCDGIATDGVGLYLATPSREAVKYWPNWNESSAKTIVLPEPTTNCVLHFDPYGNRLILAEASGNSYALASRKEAFSKLAWGLGYVNSISASPRQILFASGSKVLFYSGNLNTGQNPPKSMQPLNAKLISGVAVDSTQAAWIIDVNDSTIRGPFPLD